MENHNNLEQPLVDIQKQREEFAVSFKNEISQLSADGLSKASLKLNYLCKNINPFDTVEYSPEEKAILAEFSMTNLLEDPYNFTNVALQMLDIIEAETKNRLN